MKIKEFNIVEYGPLPDREKFSLSDFNLFYGKNESGKTLIIDALIKFLLGDLSNQYGQIIRVNEKPEGYIILLSDDDKNFKLKGKKTMNELFKIPNSEFGNLFFIRDSYLSFYKDEEFYGNITDRLLGLRLKDIEKIKKNLIDIGKLTKAGTNFRNLKDEKFLDKINNAKENKHQIIQTIQQVQEDNYDILEEKKMSLEEKIKQVEQKIQNYEDARNREKYQKGTKAITFLKQFVEDLSNLAVLNDSDRLKWRDYESDLANKNTKNNEKSEKLIEKKEDLNEIKNDIEIKEEQFRHPFKVHEVIKNKIEPQIRQYEIKKGEIGQVKEKDKFFSTLMILSVILFGIFFAVGLAGSILYGFFLGILFGIIAFILILYKYNYIKDKAWLTGFVDRLNVILSEYNLEGDTFKIVIQKIAQNESVFENLERNLRILNDTRAQLEEKINSLETTKIPNLTREISSLELNLNNLKNNSGINTYQEYEEKLQLKQEFENKVKNQKVVLESLFGLKGSTEDDLISHWNSEITKISKYKDKCKDLEYSDELVISLKAEKEKLEGRLAELKHKISQFQNELKEIELNANEILNLENDFIHCDTSNDLKILKEKLEEFISKNYQKKDDILRIIEIFDEIELEEKEKISKLLTKKSSVSDFFKEITNGDYENIIFEMETGDIKVENRKNEKIDVFGLSGGTYDQLFFAIRLGLGEKLLEGKSGFFILDDPFIKSDIDRLTRQIELLKKISKLGWQILYFTSKNEIKELFKDDIESQKISYFELETLLQ